MKRHNGQMSDSLRLGTVLTLAGGLQDAYSYNCRGQVFANAQTGNIVLLGQSLAGGQWAVALTRQIGEKTIWIAAGLMAVGFALMFLKEETSRSPST